MLRDKNENDCTRASVQMTQRVDFLLYKSPSLRSTPCAKSDSSTYQPKRLYHKGIQQAYLFGGRRYGRTEFVPGGSDEKITCGNRRPLALHQVHQLRHCRRHLSYRRQPDEGYYFFGTRFASLKFVPSSSSNDTVVDGPWVITQKLTSLSQASHYRRSHPVPEVSGEAYIFEA
ncbi:hypothetical protein BDW72DRAFT_196197 [Aspergillus terricola var. indicus]